MEKFNNLMWPLILREAKKEIAVLYSKGYNIIVMEAALLIQAKWQDACHDIWTCIIPQDEVGSLFTDKLYLYIYLITEI